MCECLARGSRNSRTAVVAAIVVISFIPNRQNPRPRNVFKCDCSAFAERPKEEEENRDREKHRAGTVFCTRPAK